MKWGFLDGRLGLALVFSVGAGRTGFYYLLYEPVVNQRGADVGGEFEALRPLLKGVDRIGYLSDEPLDDDPSLARRFDTGDMMYARAQYALAPTTLAHADRALPIALANCTSAAALEQVILSGGYRVVQRVSQTIALLRRK